MKLHIFSFAVLINFLCWPSEATANKFAACKQEYDANIGQLVASEGVATVTSILRLLFNELDLNQNEMVSSSEIVIKLETENIVSQSQMANILNQMQWWVEYGQLQENDSELRLNEFVALVDKTIGHVQDQIVPTSFGDAEFGICKYFNKKIPSLIATYRKLSRCAANLKQEQLQLLSGSERMILNTWNAVFNTIDENGDGLIEREEILTTYKNFGPTVPALFSANDTKNISDFLDAVMKSANTSKSQFFSMVHQLMFGNSNSQVWNDVATINQLYGYDFLCVVLSHTRQSIFDWIRKNENCSATYDKTLKETLNKNSEVGSGFIFAIADANKDGLMTSSELGALIVQVKPDFLSETLIVANWMPMTKTNITYILPDNVVTVNKNIQESKYELSKLQCKAQLVWNSFCLTAIEALRTFPTSLKPELPSIRAESSPTGALREVYQTLKGRNSTAGSLNSVGLLKLLGNIRNLLSNDLTTTEMPAVLETSTESQALTEASTSTSRTTGSDTFTVRPLQTSSVASGSEIDALPATTEVRSSAIPTTAPEVNTTASQDSQLAQAVREVIEDLGKTNTSLSSPTLAKDLKEFNTEQIVGKSKEERKEFSQVERELLALLTDYDKNIDQNQKQKIQATFDTSVQTLSPEESQLQQLLQRVMHEE